MSIIDIPLEGTNNAALPDATSSTWGDFTENVYNTPKGVYSSSVKLDGGTPMSSTSAVGGSVITKDLTASPVYYSGYYYVPSVPVLTLVGGSVYFISLYDGWSVYSNRETRGLHLNSDRRLQWGRYLNYYGIDGDAWWNDASAGAAVSSQIPSGWVRIESYIRNNNGAAPTINVYYGSNLHTDTPSLSWNTGTNIDGLAYGEVSYTQSGPDYFYESYRSLYANSRQGDVASNVYVDRARMSFSENPGVHPAHIPSPWSTPWRKMAVTVNGVSDVSYEDMTSTIFSEEGANQAGLLADGQFKRHAVNVNSGLGSTNSVEVIVQ